MKMIQKRGEVRAGHPVRWFVQSYLFIAGSQQVSEQDEHISLDTLRANAPVLVRPSGSRPHSYQGGGPRYISTIKSFEEALKAASTA